MTCKGLCRNSGGNFELKRSSKYVSNKNFRCCQRCIHTIFYNAESLLCPCCQLRVRTRRKNNKNRPKPRI